MARLDAYTRELLALAVEEAFRRGEWITFFPAGWDREDGVEVFEVVMYRSDPVSRSHADDDGWCAHTLAGALTLLLRDLGREVPERPSPERVVEIETAWPGPAAAAAYQRHFRRDLADRLAVLTLLEDAK